MDHTLAGLQGVYASIDDVVVTGSTREEHDQRLQSTFRRLEQNYWRLSVKKCKFGLEEIKYLGFIVNANGISADPQATHAIATLPNPANVSEVQSLLGMVNHYGKFIPHLHQLKQPLGQLTRKNCAWSWSPKHDQAVDQIKRVMLSPLLLEHYDPTKSLVVVADACSNWHRGVAPSEVSGWQ